jgi:LPS O-antigen subunit length determinant protein (WzzB/FepE family)
MTKNPQISNTPPEDEIRLIDILDFLVLNKNLILSIISFFTLSSVIYCFSVTPIYKVTISFMPSQEFYITEPSIRLRLFQIKHSIFKQFIDQIKSPDLQQKVAAEGGFLEKFKDGPNDISSTEQLISRINNSITTSLAPWKKDLNLMSPTTVEMTGKDPTVISEFLIALSAAGIETAQNRTYELTQEAISKATQNLKESIPKNVIELFRKQAKALRLRKIKILEGHMKASKNFTATEKTLIPLEPFHDFAFLNGEKAIQVLINTLKKRTEDELFLDDNLFFFEITRLQELLGTYISNQFSGNISEKNNYKLPLRNFKSVIQTIDFDAKTKLIEEKIRNLKKRPEAVIVSTENFFPQEPNTPEKAKIITFAIISGVFLGIFIAILRSGLRILKRTKSMDSP